MSDDPPARPGSVEFYRARAREALKRAEQASSDEARASFIAMAEHWQRLAQSLERPGW